MRLFAQADDLGRHTIYADRWTETANVSTALLGATDPGIAETRITFTVENGWATYRVTGVDASGHVLALELVERSVWVEPEGAARATWERLRAADTPRGETRD